MYNTAVSGTKYFIGRYLAGVTSSIKFLATTDFGDSFGLEAKETALRNTRQAFGGSALLLSGGASLGMYHFGVVRLGFFLVFIVWLFSIVSRLLHEEGLLPKVICGSSIGSFVAALVAVRSDQELSNLLQV
jgi:TAG lipase/steryl ester hydrolase/phospholipase A2/LPA acyltransferase